MQVNRNTQLQIERNSVSLCIQCFGQQRLINAGVDKFNCHHSKFTICDHSGWHSVYFVLSVSCWSNGFN